MTERANDCWVIHDGAAGNRQQAVALANAMGWAYQEKIVSASGLSKWLAPRLLPFAEKISSTAFANPPAYVIGCGRQAALVTRRLKKAGSFAIQILYPNIDSRHWDVVIAPMHDQVSGDNVIQSLGSLHGIDMRALENAAPVFAGASPRTAVLIGGPSRMATFNEGLIEVLLSHLEYDLATQGGSLMICGSRRTPAAIARKIRQRFSGSDITLWFDDSDGANIYRSALANAERIVLTPDSVNMITEACATAAPVFIAQPERASARMRLFLDRLQKIGRIKPLRRELIAFPVTPLNSMPDIVRQLKGFL